MFAEERIDRWLETAIKHSGGNRGGWMEMLHAVACALISIAMSNYNQMVYTRFSATGRWEE